MCEESTYLMPPQDDHQSSISERTGRTAPSSGSGQVGPNEALVGFHEDAITQANDGRAQYILTAILGMAIVAESIQTAMLDFILPEMGQDLCIEQYKKDWIGAVHALAMAGGSICWGILGDRLGRRRALQSCLSIATLFSTALAVMPTYGTFMTARLCFSLGISGVIPLSFTYLLETCPKATQARYSGLLHAFWPVGAFLAAIITPLALPLTGYDTIFDIKEHFSSWHRVLLFINLPAYCSIAGLFWTSESPRYLLETSREVEALEVYQRLHKINKSRTHYGLTELELPTRTSFRDRLNVPQSRSSFAYGCDMVKESISRILSPLHLHTTLVLITMHILLGFSFFATAYYAPAYFDRLEKAKIESKTRHVHQFTFDGTFINKSMENIHYDDGRLYNVTFSDIVLNHVLFDNCDFNDVIFNKVLASMTYFRDSTVRNSKFIDTSLASKHFINCTMTDNTFQSVASECDLDFDFTMFISSHCTETLTWSALAAIALFLFGTGLTVIKRRVALYSSLTLAFVALVVNILMDTKVLSLFSEGLLRALIMTSVHCITVITIEWYPCHYRCTAHGIMRCFYSLSYLLVIPFYQHLNLFFTPALGPLTGLALCTALGLIKILRETSSNLL